MKSFLAGGLYNETGVDPNNESTKNFIYILVGIVVCCILIGISIFVYFKITAKARATQEQATREAQEQAARVAQEQAARVAQEQAALVSKVRIEVNKGTEEYLNISQLVLIDNNNNIIKPIQINASEHEHSNTNKDIANDGTRKPRSIPDIYHSSGNSRKTAFYEFIIPPTKIKTIEIYNREDCCGERITKFSLYLFNSNNTILKTFPLINLPVQIINIV